MTPTRTCARCSLELPLKNFPPLRRTCRMCEGRKPPPGRGRQSYRAAIRRTHGVDVDALLIRQAGRCALCARELRHPHVDHDHESGRVRGVLCSACNTALGVLGDNPAGLRRALTYLEEAT